MFIVHSSLTDDEVEAELELLRQFDLNTKYGPCLGKKKKRTFAWICLFLVVCLTIMIARVYDGSISFSLWPFTRRHD